MNSNRFDISGVIFNYYETDRVYIVTLKTIEKARGRNHKDRGIYINYPKVYFFKNDVHKAGQMLLGDRVAISGHIVSTEKRRLNGRIFTSQALIGEDIELIDGSKNLKYIRNRIQLSGPVIWTKKIADNFYMIKLSARNKRFDNYITFTTSNKSALLVDQGDIIEVQGKIVNKVRERDGKKQYYQNLVGLSVKKVDSLNATAPSDALSKKPYSFTDNDGNVQGIDDFFFEIDPEETMMPAKA